MCSDITNSNSNSTFIALNLCQKTDSKAHHTKTLFNIQKPETLQDTGVILKTPGKGSYIKFQVKSEEACACKKLDKSNNCFDKTLCIILSFSSDLDYCELSAEESYLNYAS